jgi:hypothetical protein
MIVRKRGGWLAAKVDDEVLMMNVEQGLYVGLSAVGARIWELIDAPRDTESLCATLEQEFDVAPDVCREEVTAFLDQLARHRAIDLEP